MMLPRPTWWRWTCVSGLAVLGCGAREVEEGARVLRPTSVARPEVTIADDGTTPSAVRRLDVAARPIASLACIECHSGLYAHPNTHGALRMERGCIQCHEDVGRVHPVPGEKEFALAADARSSCQKCHAEVVSSLLTREFSHAPAKAGRCRECHEPHMSERKFLLTGEMTSRVKEPEYRRKNADLCFRCHDAAIAETEFTSNATSFRTGDRNLHYVHVVREGRSCGSCHEVHAGDQAHLIRQSLPYGESSYEIVIEYTPDRHGGSCAKSCHERKKYTRE